MIERRRLIKTVATAGTAMIAGCSTNTGDGDENDEDTGDSGNNGSSLAESGRVSAGDHTQKIEVEEGETIRVEADNEEGEATLVSLGDPEGEQIFSNFVETEDTFTHTTEQTGVFTVIISQPDGTASYQIYIE